MIELLLNSYFPNESFFDFAAAQRLLFDFLNSNLNASRFVPRKLYLTIRALTESCLFGLDEFEVVFFNVGQ
jgi:hypothetical protein